MLRRSVKCASSQSYETLEVIICVPVGVDRGKTTKNVQTDFDDGDN